MKYILTNKITKTHRELYKTYLHRGVIIGYQTTINSKIVVLGNWLQKWRNWQLIKKQIKENRLSA